jgi:deoxyadenosine/deoxycytidine kinase
MLFTLFSGRLLLDEKNQNYLIVLCPRLEDWILNVTKEISINVSKYGLPNDPNELHEALNIKLDKFRDLIDKIKQKSEMLKTLEEFIKK